MEDDIETRWQSVSRSLDALLHEVEASLPCIPNPGEWSAGDVLRHITFLHQYCAQNLQAVAAGKRPVLIEGPSETINREAVLSLQPCSIDELKVMLVNAHRDLETVVLSGTISKMTYKRGSKPKTLGEFLKSVDGHFQGHTRKLQVNRRRNIQKSRDTLTHQLSCVSTPVTERNSQ